MSGRTRGQRGQGHGVAHPRVCRHFLKGTCRFGKKCNFSHEKAANEDTDGVQKDRDEAHERFHAWKRSRFDRNPASWVATALDLVSASAYLRHQVIQAMASDDSIAIITGLVQDASIIKSAHDRQEYLNDMIMPLFRILSHPQVIDSIVLEQEVGILFRSLLGVGGARFSALFEFIFAVVRRVRDIFGSLGEPMLQILSTSAEIFAKLVDSSVSNIVNPAFHLVAEQFSAILDVPNTAEPGFWRLRTDTHLKHVRSRLGIGQALPDSKPAPPTAQERARFSLDQDLPGELSLRGPRHDNDKADIKDISIMPTWEEITSSRDEYLPTLTSPAHIGGAQGLLDRQFRLLREDIFGDLRSTVKAELDLLSNILPPTSAKSSHIKIRRYEAPCARDVLFGYKHGLELEIRILQPQFARKQERKKRMEAWEGRLSQGALVCAVDEVGTAIFFLVSASTRISAPAAEGDGRSLADDPKFAHVWLQPVDKTEDGVIKALSWYKALSGPQTRRLIEFPGILLPSALPPLEKLQRMSVEMDFPFQDILAAPETVAGPLPAPFYSLRPGFSFDLSCLCNDGTKLTLNASDDPDPATLSEHSSLDPTQAAAVLNSLQRAIAITQGPPGTGKSYTGEAIIKVLLANKESARLGPIICICYTNHALDQLLEHLLDKGVEQIVRIGSRSKSEKLAKVNLFNVSSELIRTRTEGKALYESRKALESVSEAIAQQIRSYKYENADELVKGHLADSFPHWHRQIFGDDETEDDGWTKVQKKNKHKAKLKTWLKDKNMSTAEPRPLQDLVTIGPADLSRQERMILHHHWTQVASEGRLRGSIGGLCGEYGNHRRRDERIKADINARCLESASVIGITTTGLARNQDLIRKTRAKVLVCEEAGEVLEGHLLTALLPSIEHVILIGDHLQLRPQIQDWRLQKANPMGEKFSLDMSLFERLVQVPGNGDRPRIPFNVLDTQRRMHPSIANLVRSTLYKSLVDADNVREYPEVTGMARRLFWLDHQRLESNHERKKDASDTSHSNDFEVGLVSVLVSHLLRQGNYKAGEIAVLTPYLGQLQKLRKELGATVQIVLNDRDVEDLAGVELLPAAPAPQLGKSSSLAEVRVATVDNFQGEEAKVVIVSLVRSNNERRAGFLNTSNRINVLLSRAKHGMYIVGNALTFASVPMWADVLKLLEADGNLGSWLQLRCPRHPLTDIFVQQPEDFSIMSPDGGCTLRCERRLGCGHACTGPCHADALHQAVKCLEACARPKKGCNHNCPRVCGDPCEDRCNRLMDGLDITLACGHKVSSAPCWQFQDPSKIRCSISVSKEVHGCGHSVTVPCSVDINVPEYVCKEMCGEILSCGHACRVSCEKCRQRVDGEVTRVKHGECTQPCGREFTNCSHSCQKGCHDGSPCPPCRQLCETRCSHSRCNKICSEPCAPCAEMTCSSECPHSQCRMPCAVPCDWVPCSERCQETLSCGHRCPSLCGEKCPDVKFCQFCASDEVRSMVVDLYIMAEYKDINLDEEPCIFPDCGHPLTFSNMDAQMGLASHYIMDANGTPTAVKAPQMPFSSPTDVKIKACPQCRGPLRNVARYGRLVRRGLLDEATKKFIAWSAETLNRLAMALAAAEEALDSQVENQGRGHTVPGAPLATPKAVDLTLSRRDRFKAVCASLPGATKMWRVRVGLENHLGKVGMQEQPYQQVANRVRFGGFQGGEVEVQMGSYVKTLAMLLRCDVVILEHYFARHAKSKDDKIDLDEYILDFNEFTKLVDERRLWRLKAEGHILLGRLYSIAHRHNQAMVGSVFPTTRSPLELGEEQIQRAEIVLQATPSVESLRPQLDALAQSFRNTFYSPVTGDERRAVYRAMAQEFSGTGHWYTCELGHPFTVGECGMPMERARCPECGAPVGGQNHNPVEGVQRATDMEELGRDMARMMA